MIENILKDIIRCLYMYSGGTLLFTVLFLGTRFLIEDKGTKWFVNEIKSRISKNKKFIFEILVTFLGFLIFYKTLIGRFEYVNPWDNVIGDWAPKLSDGSYNYDAFENIGLFIPFTFSLSAAYLSDVRIKKYRKSCFAIILYGGMIALAYSVCIECCQLFFRIGKFQLSDIGFNTIGGVCGAFIYVLLVCFHSLIVKVRKRIDANK